MKKVDDYIIDFWGTLKDGITKNGRYVSDYDIKLVLKQLQKDTIKETCRVCVEEATTKDIEVEYTGVRAGGNYFIKIVDEQSILQVADKLIEKL